MEGRYGISVEYEKHWSKQCTLTKPGALQGIIMQYAGKQSTVNMHGGLPPAQTFPFRALTAELTHDNGALEINDPKSMVDAQQYNMHIQGLPELVNWALDTTKKMQKPLQQVSCVLSSGATQAVDVVLSMLLDPGAPLLIEQYTWAHALEMMMVPRGYKLVPVQMDAQGMRADDLSSILDSWDTSLHGPKPKALYLIPTGQNPTGVCMTHERRAVIYAVAAKHDVVIIEDEAYCWLQWPEGSANPPGMQVEPGFLSLDTDGRVIRIDTLAKLLGPGFRLGWITGVQAVIDKAKLFINGMTVGPCGVSQVLVSRLLQHWGEQGFDAHLKNVQGLYGQKAEQATAAASQHLTGLAEWTQPTSGMFMWIRVPRLKDTTPLVHRLAAEGVIVVPGCIFCTGKPWSLRASRARTVTHAGHREDETHTCTCVSSSEGGVNGEVSDNVVEVGEGSGLSLPCQYFRVSFASLSEEAFQQGFMTMARVIRELVGEV